MINRSPLKTIINQFAVDPNILSITPIGSGHVNKTYEIKTQSGVNYLLQKINQHVFRDVPALMHNFEIVTQHIQQKLRQENHPMPEQAGLTMIRTLSGSSYLHDDNQEAWRLLRFINDSYTHELVTDPKLVEEGAYAFGKFQRSIATIDPAQLKIVIPSFHNLTHRLTLLKKALTVNRYNRVKIVGNEINYIEQMQDRMLLTQQLLNTQKIPLRITHNDTKINNILFNEAGHALCVIDLDTIMPGVFQFDFSDTVRTMANTGFEDEIDLEMVSLDTELFKAVASGYLRATRPILTTTEIELLSEATHLMPFMIGVRFLTDYLEGDCYFKTSRPDQNLDRARCQFKLTEDIERQKRKLKKIIETLI
jgi:hypothetical protein